MSDWTEGYVTDIGYTYGYYPFLNPVRARLAFLQRGLAFPKVENACELGFGQGLSVNIHAAASTAKWYGTDFMPEQAAFAQKLASVAQSDAQLFADSFDAFARRKDLPDFDFIGLHGIWSWINNSNRRIIVNFLKKKLKPGGVLYISYNTMPGWSDFLPIRHLMTKYFISATGSARDRIRQIQDTVQFMNYFLSTKPKFMEANPGLSKRMHELRTRDPHYLAHEYFNQDWYPMYFADMGDWLQEAQLEYACSAEDATRHFELTDDQGDFLEKLADPMLKESITDFMTNRQFRVDYWVKGTKELSRKEQTAYLRDQRFLLRLPLENFSFTIQNGQGKMEFDQAIYKPIIELMSDFRPRNLCEMEQELSGKDIKWPQLSQAALVLSTWPIHLEVVQDEAAVEQAKARTDRLNSFLCELSRKSTDITWLSSPMTGGGTPVASVEQLFLESIKLERQNRPAEWAHYAWRHWAPLGAKVLIKDGKPLETEEESLAELERQASEFQAKRLPMLKALGIA